MGARGRGNRIPDDVCDLVVELVASGLSIRKAADAVDYDERTVQRAANRDPAGFGARLTAARKAAARIRPLPPHGTPGRYRTHRCRCEKCRADNTRRHRQSAERAAANGWAGLRHGGAGAYSLGCRCQPCRARNAEKCAAYKARRREQRAAESLAVSA